MAGGSGYHEILSVSAATLLAAQRPSLVYGVLRVAAERGVVPPPRAYPSDQVTTCLLLPVETSTITASERSDRRAVIILVASD